MEGEPNLRKARLFGGIGRQLRCQVLRGMTAAVPEGRATLRQLSVQRAAGNVAVTTIAVIAALNLGRDVFLPLVIAMLITSAVSPVVKGVG
jgi:hypothetical protein